MICDRMQDMHTACRAPDEAIGIAFARIKANANMKSYLLINIAKRFIIDKQLADESIGGWARAIIADTIGKI